MKIAHTLAAALLSVGAVSAANAASHVLTFDAASACGSSACVTGDENTTSHLTSSYGSTSDVVVYNDWYYGTLDNSSSDQGTLYYWDTGYGSLTDVAWGGDTTGQDYSEAYIALLGQGSNAVTLTSFDLAVYSGESVDGEWWVYDDGSSLVAHGTFASGQQTISVNTTSKSLGIVWTGGLGTALVGVDNIVYSSVSAIPEPESYAMLLGGLAAVGAVKRRRAAKKA